MDNEDNQNNNHHLHKDVFLYIDDLNDLKQLLEQSVDSGVDIYTHSEMLPGHYYPELKKYPHFFGNYGNAWWKQKEEFEKIYDKDT